MNKYRPVDVKCKCPVCGQMTLYLTQTPAQISPFLEGCYHRFYGASCFCGAHCEGVFLKDGDANAQLEAAAKEIMRQTENICGGDNNS